MFSFLSSPTIDGLVQAYGLWALFAAVMLESTGVPIPGETALISAALYAGATNRVAIFSVVIVAAAAAIVGDNIGYLIGRTLGVRLLVRYGHYVNLTESRLRIGHYLFQRHGAKIVFFGRFVAILRAIAALLAGANRMYWPRFLAMNALGGMTWAALVGFAAYLFGEQMTRVAGPVGLILLAVTLGLIVVGISFFVRHEKQLETSVAAAISNQGIKAASYDG